MKLSVNDSVPSGETKKISLNNRFAWVALAVWAIFSPNVNANPLSTPINAEYADINNLSLYTGGTSNVTFYSGANQYAAPVNFSPIPVGSVWAVSNWGQGSIIINNVQYIIDFDIEKIEYNTWRANIDLANTDALFSGNNAVELSWLYDTPTSLQWINLEPVIASAIPEPESVVLILIWWATLLVRVRAQKKNPAKKV
jgi:hypothetical protein